MATYGEILYFADQKQDFKVLIVSYDKENLAF